MTATASSAQGAVIVGKPGELQASFSGMREHVATLPFVVLLRRRGGLAIRVGAGLRTFEQPWTFMLRQIARQSDVCYWRDPDTHRHLHGDGWVPDLAFAQGSSNNQLRDRILHARSKLVISYRGDRPAPSNAVVTAIARFASSARLIPTVVSQVARDDTMTRDLAARLRCSAIQWNDYDLLSQEERLRRAYAQSVVVVSDRLHVLIAAATEGAVPAALLDGPNAKIERHFALLPSSDARLGPRTSGPASPAALQSFLGEQVEKADAVVELVSAYRARLASVERLISARVSAVGQSNGLERDA